MVNAVLTIVCHTDVMQYARSYACPVIGLFLVSVVLCVASASHAAVLVGAGEAAGAGSMEEPPATRLANGVSNTMTLENCDCDDTGVGAGFDNVFYQSRQVVDGAEPTNRFDDIIVFGNRASMSAVNE